MKIEDEEIIKNMMTVNNSSLQIVIDLQSISKCNKRK